MYVDAGLGAMGRMPQWWLDVERQYRNENPGLNQGPDGQNKGYDEFHIPLTQPRLDMLTAQVTTVIGKQNPYMTDMTDPEAISEPKQQLVHSIWKDAGFETKIRDAATIVGCTDVAFYRLCPNYAQRGAVDLDVIHPDSMIVYPALPKGIQAATCVGHRLEMRRYLIESMQDGITYYKGDPPSISSQDEHDDDREQSHTGANLGDLAPDDATELCEIWPLVVRLDLKHIEDENTTERSERLYQATLDYKSGRLLKLEEYDYDYIWYFRSQFIGSPRYFYSGQSVGRNLYPIQDMYNALWSGFFAGAMQAASGGPVIGEGLTSGEKFQKFGMTTVIESDSPVTPWQGSVHFDGQPFPRMIASCEEIADKVARISQNTQGAQAQGSTTATEQSIIAAGVAVGIEQFIARFSQDFPAMAALTCQIAAFDFEAFAQRYGQDIVEPEALIEPGLGPLMGSNTNVTPNIVEAPIGQ